MSANYQAIQWNKFKIRYDTWLALAIMLYVLIFVLSSLVLIPTAQQISPVTLLIRALGSCAFIMLHLILALGPLARLSPVFKPLLYNRRHLGVATFLIATAHICLALLWYHAFGVLSPLASLIFSNPNYSSLASFPFELYGAAAYLILLFMALSSHDFWLKFFSPPIWKLLHMGVYLAYALLLAHVLFGFVQDEGQLLNLYLLGAAAAALASLHLWTGWVAWTQDRRHPSRQSWVPVIAAAKLINNQGTGVTLSTGDKIAIFRYNQNQVVAVANACAHQNGPLCEGRIKNGRIVCPWHGYEYIPTTGRAPAPFNEKIATYQVRLRDGILEVKQQPNAPGTPTTPATIT